MHFLWACTIQRKQHERTQQSALYRLCFTHTLAMVTLGFASVWHSYSANFLNIITTAVICTWSKWQLSPLCYQWSSPELHNGERNWPGLKSMCIREKLTIFLSFPSQKKQFLYLYFSVTIISYWEQQHDGWMETVNYMDGMA